MTDLAQDALARLEDAKSRRLLLIGEWERLGKPVLSPTGRSPHPLLKAMNDVDALCTRLERELAGLSRAGRPAGAVSAPDRQPPRVRRV